MHFAVVALCSAATPLAVWPWGKGKGEKRYDFNTGAAVEAVQWRQNLS